jgi:hypothetical protein
MDSRDDDARWRQLGPLLHARDLAPADLDAALALARAYAAMERFDLAARECERALALALADDTAAAAAEEELLHLQLEPPPTKEARMLAKERLRFLLLQASSKAVAMAARDRWRAAMAAAAADDDERRRLPDGERRGSESALHRRATIGRSDERPRLRGGLGQGHRRLDLLDVPRSAMHDCFPHRGVLPVARRRRVLPGSPTIAAARAGENI